MKGEGIRKQIDGKTQKKTDQNKDGPALLDGIPIQEQQINHRIDKAQEIQFIENQYLSKDQENKP
jgi:hypothetical protein